MESIISNIRNWLKSRRWPRLIISGKGEDASQFSRREKVLVFSVAYVIAFSLWLMVNLDREFSFDIEMPLSTDNIPEDMALVSPLPETITVGISGEGWKLLNLYNNPPTIQLNLESTPVNVFEQVRNLFVTNQDVNVTKVQPSILNANLEERISRRVPVELRSDLQFRRQHSVVGDIQMQPDSITVSGARSRIQDITSWPTQLVTREDIRENLDVRVRLDRPTPVIDLSAEEVHLTARVSEFTEGEVRVAIQPRGLPGGRSITFIPASVSVRYSVPIEEYMESQELAPFEVYVPYSQILADTTGLVMPNVELTSDALNIRLRGAQPRNVTYFIVVPE